MIILDTNVISEAMRGSSADRSVLSWIRSLREQPVTTVVNRAELLSGVALLPDGKRRDALAASAREALAGLGVCLPLTPEAADEYADIVATRRHGGRPIGGMDALVAAIARVSGAGIATRNTDDFAGLGLDLIDPWHA